MRQTYGPAKEPAEQIVKDIRRATRKHHSPEQKIRIVLEGDRFLKQMVRAIVGTLVETGQGKRTPDELKRILEAKDRRAAGYTAPPYGLYLVSVTY